MRHFGWGCTYSLVLLPFLCSTILAQGLSTPTLQATAFELHYVALQWTDWEQYHTNRIERKSGGSDWTVVAETGQANSYMDRSTVPGVTYTYRVQALTSQALFTYSNEASATTAGPTLQPPTAPNFVADVSFNNIHLRWIPREGVAEYKIEMMDANTPWHEVISLGGNSSNYLVTPLIEGMTYYFRICASNHAGASCSPVLPITAPYDPSIIPPAPTIQAFPRTDKSITLQWELVPRAWGYLVEARSRPSGSWIRIENVGRDITSAVHENLQPSTQYSFRILAYNGAGDSEYSTEATTSTYPPPPSSPQLRGFPVSYSETELRWTDVLTNCCTTPGYIGYRLEAWNGNAWAEIDFAGVDETNHFVGGLQPSTEYTYRIVALHPLASEWSTNTVRTMDPPPIPPPSAPVFYADQCSSIAIDLKWIDVYLEMEYRIERENFPGGGVWQQIAVVPANSTSYRDIDLEPGKLYVYRIRAANSYGTSPYSHEAAARTPPPPGFPLLAAGATSPTTLSLLVQPGEGAVQYQLQRLNRNDEWDVLYETNSAPFRFEDTGLTPFTPYTYRVRSRDDDRVLVWWYSAEITSQTWPLEFIAFGRALSSDGLELSWPSMPYAEHIYIRQLTNGVWAGGPIELDGTATNYIITGLTPDTAYTYSIYAGNNFGGRSPEAQLTVKTLGSISGDIVFRSITPADNGANFRIRLTGSTGQKFKIQSTTDFDSWTDRTDALTLSADMDVGVPAAGTAAFYRTIKVN